MNTAEGEEWGGGEDGDDGGEIGAVAEGGAEHGGSWRARMGRRMEVREMMMVEVDGNLFSMN